MLDSAIRHASCAGGSDHVAGEQATLPGPVPPPVPPESLADAMLPESPELSDEAAAVSAEDPVRLEVPVERVGAEICRLAGQIAAATSRFLRLLADFDARQGWAGVNIASCAHWLNWKCGLDLRTAREHVRVARALTELPKIQEAFDAGRISYSKARAIARVATPTSEADLLEAALHAPASYVERLTRGLRTAQKNDPEHSDDDSYGLKPPPRPTPPKEITWQWDCNTKELLISGRLDAADGARLLAAATRTLLELSPTGDPEAEATAEAGTNGSAEPSAAGSAADPSPSQGRGPDGEPAMTTRPPSDLGPALLAMAEMVCTHLQAPVHAPAADVLVTVDLETLAEAFATEASEAAADPAASEASANDPAVAGPGQEQSAEEPDVPVGSDASVDPADVLEPAATSSGGDRAPRSPFTRSACLDDGPALTNTCLRRLIDDGRLRFALTAPDGRILDLGRASRTPSASQFRALWRRDHGCSVPGCERTRLLHAHHVVFWSNGGPTTLDNLVLLCSFHHHRLHDGEFSITALGRQQFRFTGPDGITYAPAPQIDGSAEELIAEFPDIEPETIQPDWDGTPIHNYAIATYLANWIVALQNERLEQVQMQEQELRQADESRKEDNQRE